VEKENIKNIISALPNEPGIYQYFDKDGKIIYVGKAKDLKKRVSSYFTKIHDNRKTQVLVKNIYNIKTIIVETEHDALILENNLIKKYQPRYNILLKDDKTYPWICIKNERFPRVFQTRNFKRDGSSYFGPFTSGLLSKTLVEFLSHTYKIRTCNYLLSEENVSRGKFKVCLQYHIGNCLGPCEMLQDELDYMDRILEITNILKGNIGTVISDLKLLMNKLSIELKFEEALRIKERLNIIQKFQSKSTVVSPTIKNVDVYSFMKEEHISYVNFLRIINGAVIQSFTIELKERIEESDEDLLLTAISEIRQKIHSDSKEIIVPFKPSFQLKNLSYTIPVRGEKKKLLELSEKNVKFYILEKKKKSMNLNKEIPSERILKTAQKDLRLKEIPFHIECFDNSNLSGTNPVASCVVFKNAKPAKKEYRHFNIKTVEGPNDFASMEEIIFRRYKRIIDEGLKFPNLIIVDGGKGQLSSAMSALDKLELKGKIPVIGIAKKLEEIYYPEDQVPLYIDKTSETLKLIQRMRDEAHRFGITHHRGKRTKQMLNSELDNIKGIGEKTKEVLLKSFKTVESIKKTSSKEIESVIGRSKAKILIDYFNCRSQS
jgi:excinuclease ABC subunit C